MKKATGVKARCILYRVVQIVVDLVVEKKDQDE